jgi:hypothetical protein
VRVLAAKGLGEDAPLGAVAAGLACVAAERDREEGETYARGAGRLLVRLDVPASTRPAAGETVRA